MKLTKSNKRSLEVLIFFLLPVLTLGTLALLLVEKIFRGFVS